MSGVRRGNILITLGILLLVGALGLSAYNIMGDRSAGAEAESILSQVKTLIDQGQDYEVGLEDELDYQRNPEMELPRANIAGHECVGVLQLPAIGIELPVIADFNYDELLAGPCRFFGSPYMNNLVICAHNYDTHFRRIRDLKDGDKVIFVDMDGNVFTYSVGLVEVLEATDVTEMCVSDWDLSLFTCTFDSQSRVTVRCLSDDNDAIIHDIG